MTAVFVACAMPCAAAGQVVVESGDDIEWVAEDAVGDRAGRSDGDVTEILKRPGLEKVIGADDRENIGNTTAYPWRTIGEIAGEFASTNGTTVIRRGTGVLIGTKTVLTAGHVLVKNRQWGDNTTFTPGKDGSDEPYGKIKVSRKRVKSQYWNDEDSNYDIALIILAEPVGNQTDYMRIEVKQTSFFDDAGLNVAGYPGDLGSSQKLYHAFGHSDGVYGNRIRHNADTASGESGAPVWVYNKDENKRRLVGVHISGGESYNYAVRINSSLFDWINDSLKEHDTIHYETTPGSDGNGGSGGNGGAAGAGQGPFPGGACPSAGVLALAVLTLLAFGVIRPLRHMRR
jgi:glutamyl endopeptidase